jgi:hypothetical protein
VKPRLFFCAGLWWCYTPPGTLDEILKLHDEGGSGDTPLEAYREWYARRCIA